MDKHFVRRGAFALVMIAIGVFFLYFDKNEADTSVYQTNTGYIFGTYYRISYQHESDLHDAILARLQAFDASLSMFNKQSILSRINRNEDVQTNADFEQMFALASEISRCSQGAFDITVAPLVNAWGFGFKNKEQVTSATIDSLLPYVGFQKVQLTEHRITKDNPHIMLDAGAIAKGQGCDVVANLLRQHGSENFLVDIGGEVVCQGTNAKGEYWRVGIVKPQDDPTGQQNNVQELVSAPRLALATSGNYRQFYYEDGVRRSHTIDPRTGYPVQHNLLSATVIAPSCMQADALATACMVLGTTEALQMIEAIDSVECYLIYAEGETFVTVQSDGMKQYIHE